MIWAAIRSRKQIAFSYKDEARLASPNVLGYKHDGREAVLAFQLAGGTTSTLPKGGGWKCFFVERMSDITLVDGPPYSGTQHTTAQTCVNHVDVDVNIPETLTRDQPLAFGSPDLLPPRGSLNRST